MNEGGRSSFPLPEGEREGPAPPLPAAWEGEGGIRHRNAVGATSRARALRQASTDAERRLWTALRGSKLGVKFRRQVAIGRYIADFVCPARRLIVEVDGGQHNIEVDSARTSFLEGQGYSVLRFWNNEVLSNIDGVCHTIAAATLRQTTPTRAAAGAASLASPLQGEEAKPC